MRKKVILLTSLGLMALSLGATAFAWGGAYTVENNQYFSYGEGGNLKGHWAEASLKGYGHVRKRTYARTGKTGSYSNWTDGYEAYVRDYGPYGGSNLDASYEFK